MATISFPPTEVDWLAVLGRISQLETANAPVQSRLREASSSATVQIDNSEDHRPWLESGFEERLSAMESRLAQYADAHNAQVAKLDLAAMGMESRLTEAESLMRHGADRLDALTVQLRIIEDKVDPMFAKLHVIEGEFPPIAAKFEALDTANMAIGNYLDALRTKINSNAEAVADEISSCRRGVDDLEATMLRLGSKTDRKIGLIDGIKQENASIMGEMREIRGLWGISDQLQEVKTAVGGLKYDYNNLSSRLAKSELHGVDERLKELEKSIVENDNSTRPATLQELPKAGVESVIDTGSSLRHVVSKHEACEQKSSTQDLPQKDALEESVPHLEPSGQHPTGQKSSYGEVSGEEISGQEIRSEACIERAQKVCQTDKAELGASSDDSRTQERVHVLEQSLEALRNDLMAAGERTRRNREGLQEHLGRVERHIQVLQKATSNRKQSPSRRHGAPAGLSSATEHLMPDENLVIGRFHLRQQIQLLNNSINREVVARRAQISKTRLYAASIVAATNLQMERIWESLNPSGSLLGAKDAALVELQTNWRKLNFWIAQLEATKTQEELQVFRRYNNALKDDESGETLPQPYRDEVFTGLQARLARFIKILEGGLPSAYTLERLDTFRDSFEAQRARFSPDRAVAESHGSMAQTNGADTPTDGAQPGWEATDTKGAKRPHKDGNESPRKKTKTEQ